MISFLMHIDYADGISLLFYRAVDVCQIGLDLEDKAMIQTDDKHQQNQGCQPNFHGILAININGQKIDGAEKIHPGSIVSAEDDTQLDITQ